MRRRPTPVVDDYAEVADDYDVEPSRSLVVQHHAVAHRTPGMPAVFDAAAAERARLRRLPVEAAAVTAGVGTGVYSAAQAALSMGMPTVAGAIVVGTGAASVAAIPGLRWWWRNTIPDAWRGAATRAVALAGGWATSVAVVGPWSWTAAAALGLGTLAAGARLSAANEEHLPVAAPVMVAIEPAPPVGDEPPEEPTDAAYVLAKRWRERVADGSKTVLKGARLTDRKILPNAVTWIIDTDGDFTYDEMAKARGRIAARLGISATNVVVEPVEDDESKALLTIVTRDVLRGGVSYEGPRYEIRGDHHLIPLAVAADGTGWLDHVAVDEVGVRPALLTGEPGSGKTASLEAIEMGRLSSGRWRLLFADGDPGGGSSPLLNQIGHMVGAGPLAALRVVQALDDVIEIRSRLKPTLTETADGRLVTITDPATQAAVREIRPCVEYPGYVGVFDEFHRLTKDPWLADHPDGKFTARVERILRIGRKYGVTLDVATQSLLADDYGNSTNLRGFLAARNAWIHRSGNKSEQHTINGVALAPGALPKKPGYAFAAGSGRLCLTRVAWSKTMGDHAAHFPPCPGDRLSELAVARHRPQEQDADAALEDQLRLVAEWEAAITKGVGLSLTPTPAPVSAQPSRPATGGALTVTIPKALTGDNVVPIRPRPAPAPTGPVTAEQVFGAAQLAAARLSERYRAILDVLCARCGEVVTNAEILAELRPRFADLEAPAVTQGLKRLVALGMAHRDGQGAHRVVAGPVRTGAVS